MTLEDYLEVDARLYPDKTAVVCGSSAVTYAGLLRMVDSRVGELQREGYEAGQTVCLRAASTTEFLVDYFALHRFGCVVAPLEQGTPDATFADIARHLGAHTCPEGTADILYTTGTTGVSKGVMISHRTIIADAENLIDGQGFSHDLAFVVSGPLNHIGSLSKLYPIILLGATIIIVDGMKDLSAFFSAFDGPYRRMATFLVPASIRILLQMAPRQLQALADRMEFIETGAAAISRSDMEALCRLLPHTRLYNTYASTETGIISTYNYNDGRCIAGCLGRPMRHSRLVITDGGTIACSGPTLMTGYVGDAGRTAAVLRDGVVYTSDLGTIDDEGMLHLTGREGDVINVGGYKVAPTEVEGAAMAFAGVADCVCTAVDHPLTGKALKLLVVMSEGATLDKRALAHHLSSRLETYKVPMLYAQVDKVERTFNGKINRKAYIFPR